ncbi:hypothetical protein VTG60DRAFT_3065 [Thermothelomyces hinnuleus]
MSRIWNSRRWPRTRGPAHHFHPTIHRPKSPRTELGHKAIDPPCTDWSPLSRSSPRLSGSALGSPVAAACFQVAIGLSAFPSSVTANQLPNHPKYHFIRSLIVELRGPQRKSALNNDNHPLPKAPLIQFFFGYREGCRPNDGCEGSLASTAPSRLVTHFDILCRRRILDRLSFLGLGLGEPTSWTYGSETSEPRKGRW